jgi:hypothetical protein
MPEGRDVSAALHRHTVTFGCINSSNARLSNQMGVRMLSSVNQPFFFIRSFSAMPSISFLE